MSTRYYPLYQKGGPQLRVYLPNFWLKLIRPCHEQPSNVVQFACSMEMTRYDIRNYLEKIYNVKSVDIRTRIALGKTKRDLVKGYVVKEDDVKLAYVTLPKNEKFDYPNLYIKDEEKKEKDKKVVEETKQSYNKFVQRSRKESLNLPGWFTT